MSIGCKAIVLIRDRELAKKQFEEYILLVSSQKRKRIKRFRSYSDAQNCLLGDVLLRSELCKATGLVNDDLSFSQNQYGKPYLENNTDSHFNISHSGKYVAIVVCEKPVGIDIETVKPFNEKAARRFFTPDEITYILNAPEDVQNKRFTEIWTKKESRIKYEGKGLSMPLTSFCTLGTDNIEGLTYYEVINNNDAICHICNTLKTPPEIKTLTIRQFVPCESLCRSRV